MIKAVFDLDLLKQECVWFALIFGAVTLSMLIDLIAGVHKARKRHEATTSKGLKRTATKAEKYYLPLLCAVCFDIIISPLSSYPIFTGVIGLFLVVCEFKSIFESTRTKSELREAENTMKVIVKNKDDVSTIVSEVMRIMAENSEKRIENSEKTVEDGETD